MISSVPSSARSWNSHGKQIIFVETDNNLYCRSSKFSARRYPSKAYFKTMFLLRKLSSIEGSQNSEGLKMSHVLVILAAGTFTPTAGATTAATTWSSIPSPTARQGSATSRRWQTGSTYEFPGKRKCLYFKKKRQAPPHSFATALLIPCFLHCVQYIRQR